MSNKSLRPIAALACCVLAVFTLTCSWMDTATDILANPGGDIDTVIRENEQVQAEESVPQAGAIPTSSSHAGSESSTLRPVIFRNLGTVPYTVSPWTYTPGNSMGAAIPSNASTVSTPGGNTSSALHLPLGTYTWCYWWELGDINDDGMIDYAHALDERPVTLQDSDSEDIAFAQTVDLAAPADVGMAFGACGMDVSQFVVEEQHVDSVSGAAINMGHDADYVVLRGPIAVVVWYVHAPVEIGPGVPTERTQPEVFTIPPGASQKFELVDGRDDHQGDWNMYIWLISVNE